MSRFVQPSSGQPLPEFTIWRDERGRWIAHDARGLVGGLFVSRREAVRFALHEANDDPLRVRVVSKSGGLHH
jgi:hypothetical protein